LNLGKTVIGQYHGAEAAQESAQRWEREISQGELNADIPVAAIAAADLQEGKLPAARLLVAAGLCNSTSDARRAIAQGGAYLGEEKQRLDDPNTLIEVQEGILLRVGKKRICRVQIED